MASSTFTVAGKRVTVRTSKPKPETGLLRMVTTTNHTNVTVVVDGITYKNVGTISATYSFVLGGRKGLWDWYNSLSFEVPRTDPTRYGSFELAFEAVCKYIKSQLLHETFVP